MDVLYKVIHALWHQDFTALANPDMVWIVYGIIFITLFLENGLLPAAFLPGDSLLLLSGVMVAKGVMAFIPALILLTIAASLGCWIGYLQGRWLGNTPLIKNWLQHLPGQYHQRAWQLFHRHGLAALLTGRFLAFVRTLLPALAGISGMDNKRFQLFNWLSGLLWVGCIVTFGYAIGQIPWIKRYEDQVMTILLILPLLLLFSGLVGTIIVVIKHKKPR
ncbi:DedA family protein [Enterobacteriaceae bacterium LUAb1]